MSLTACVAELRFRGAQLGLLLLQAHTDQELKKIEPLLEQFKKDCAAAKAYIAEQNERWTARARAAELKGIQIYRPRMDAPAQQDQRFTPRVSIKALSPVQKMAGHVIQAASSTFWSVLNLFNRPQTFTGTGPAEWRINPDA